MTKQINFDPNTKFVRIRNRAGVAEWLGAIAAILTILAILAIIVGGALWLVLKIWTSILSMM